jgi:transcriptional regulator with XRE-family HTH domain
MAVTKDPGAARELADGLRDLRERANLTTRQMAEKLGLSNANITHWESGNRLIPVERLAAYLDALDVSGDDRERLLGLRRRAEGPGELTAGVPSIGPQLTQLIEHEQTAVRMVEYAPLAIPGLLQTTDYARAVLSRGPNVDTRVALRAGRRDVLTRRRDPVEFLALIDSEVLARPIASAAVMRDQYEHLLEMSKHDNVTVRIVPSTTPGWHPGLAGNFILFEFASARPIVHVEHYRASSFLWDESDVADYREAAREIEEKAMTSARTAEAIEKMISGMEPR